jgi:hypothetical protein
MRLLGIAHLRSENPRLILCLLAFLATTTGCLRAPTHPDENYPPEWPQLSSLGTKCQSLAGSYLNKGVVLKKGEPAREVLLSNLLLRGSIADIDVLSLRTDVGFAFTTLYVTSGSREVEVPHCVCYNETVLVPSIDASSWGFPYVGMGGSQTNAWLTKATDGSLVVLIEGNTSGIVLIVPYYYQGSTAWGRFQSAAGAGVGVGNANRQ